MRKKYMSVYIFMTFLFFCISLMYHSEANIYAMACSSLYYVFLYVPIYLFLINRVLEDSFQSIMILRIGSKVKNAVKYIKTLLFHTILFSIWFVLCLIFVEASNKGFPTFSDMQFYFAIFIIQVIGWSVIGLLQYTLYTITREGNISVFLTWLVCIIMGMSESVLFRLGKYIYNIFKTMTIWERPGNYLEKANVECINMIVGIVLVIVIVICQKNMDIIERRR